MAIPADPYRLQLMEMWRKDWIGSVRGSSFTIWTFILLLLLAGVTLSMFARLGAVVLFTPSFVFPAIAIAAFGGWLGQVYIKAQLCVKREMSTAKAPVLGILGGAIAGLRGCHLHFSLGSLLTVYPTLASIRAYRAQSAFKNETANRVNRYVRAARSYYNLNRCAVVTHG